LVNVLSVVLLLLWLEWWLLLLLDLSRWSRGLVGSLLVELLLLGWLVGLDISAS
jgi:hypothetical protein